MNTKLILLICSTLMINQVFPQNVFSKESQAQYVVCPNCTKISSAPQSADIEKITCNYCKSDLSLADLKHVSYKEASELKYKIYKEMEKRADEKSIPDLIITCCPKCGDKARFYRYDILRIVEGRKSRIIKCSIKSCGNNYDIVEGIEEYRIRKIKQNKDDAILLGSMIGVLGILAAAKSSTESKQSYSYPYLKTTSTPRAPMSAPAYPTVNMPNNLSTTRLTTITTPTGIYDVQSRGNSDYVSGPRGYFGYGHQTGNTYLYDEGINSHYTMEKIGNTRIVTGNKGYFGYGEQVGNTYSYQDSRGNYGTITHIPTSEETIDRIMSKVDEERR